MNELENYESQIGKVYLDFYKKNVGFLSTFDAALTSPLERDERAIRRIIYDVYTFDVSGYDLIENSH